MKQPYLFTQKLVSTSLAFSLGFSSLMSAAPGFCADLFMTGDVSVNVSPAPLNKMTMIPGGKTKVNLVFRNVAVEDALRALAKRGGFNVALDDTVQGNLSVDLHNVTILDALETLKTYGKLAYSAQGNTLVVSSADSPAGQAMQRSITRIIPLHYANAKTMADILNRSIFANPNGGSTNTVQKASPDFRTNSVIIVGNESDVQSAQEHLQAMDIPRESKTWRLNHANALDIASMLNASIFNDGMPSLSLSGGSGSSAGGGVQSSSMRVQAENLTEGTGGSTPTGAGGSGGGGSSTSASSISSSLTLRGRVKQDQTVQISPQGPIILPDTRVNSITVLGTAEQIAMADKLIERADMKVPQVVLEASLIEIKNVSNAELGFSNGMNAGSVAFGSNNVAGTSYGLHTPFTSPIGLHTPADNALASLLRITSQPITGVRNLAYQVNALVHSNKAKLLANPSIIATHDNEAVISIVDEIIRSVTVTLGGSTPGAPVIASSSNIGEAGIVLNILPKIGANGTVSMRVRPTVSSIHQTTIDHYGNLVTLLAKREALAQNITLKDGESFVIGGLVQETNSNAVSKVPGAGDLPIVGALARSSTKAKNRSELIIVITPHILRDDVNADHISQNTASPNLPQINTTSVANSPAADNSVPAVSEPVTMPAVAPSTPVNQTETLPEKAVKNTRSTRLIRTSAKTQMPQLTSLKPPVATETSADTTTSTVQIITTTAVPTQESKPAPTAVVSKPQVIVSQETSTPQAMLSTTITPSGTIPSDDEIKAIMAKFKN